MSFKTNIRQLGCKVTLRANGSCVSKILGRGWGSTHRTLPWLLPACLSLLAAPCAMAKKDGPTLVIQSNIKTIIIKREGIIVGHENSPVILPVGESALELSAKDYVLRVIHVSLASPTDRIQLQVNLIKSPPGARATVLPWDLPKSAGPGPAVTELPSVCRLRPPAADFICPRATVDDDIAFSGLVWQDLSQLPKMSEEVAQSLAEKTPMQLATDEKFMHEMDVFWARTPGSEPLNALMARLLMFRGSCGRIDEILMENQRAGLPFADVKLLGALCYERTARPEIGLALLEKHFDATPKTPQLYYHRIRRLLPDYAVDAKKLVVACVREFPSYYPCYEMWSFLESLRGKTSMNVRNAYLKKNQEGQKSAILDIARLQKAGKLKEAGAMAAAQMQIHQLSFEITWLAVGIEKAQGIQSNINIIREKSRYLRILNRQLASDIVAGVAAHDKGDILGLAYRSFVKEFPREMSYWMNLIKLADAKGECPAVVSLAQESYPFLVARDRYKMSLWEGLCLVKLERLDDAVTLYLKLTEENALLWSGYYNLGAVYERIGDKKKALAVFKKAVEKRPPPAALAKLLDKIEYYDKRGVGKTDDQDDGGSGAIEITTQSEP